MPGASIAGTSSAGACEGVCEGEGGVPSASSRAARETNGPAAAAAAAAVRAASIWTYRGKSLGLWTTNQKWTVILASLGLILIILVHYDLL